MKIFTPLLALIFLLFYGCSSTKVELHQKSQPNSIQWQDKIFTIGDKVRVRSWAGVIQPERSGFTVPLTVNEGQTGKVIGFAERKLEQRESKNEPLQLVIVKWDSQPWYVTHSKSKWEPLPEFETSIHADYLILTK